MKVPTVTAALIAINATVAAIAAVVKWAPPHPEATLKALQKPEPSVVIPAEFKEGPPITVAALRTSPVFYRSRELIEVEDPAQVLASRPNYVLSAAMLLPRGKHIAYLKAPGPGSDTIRVQEGDSLQGWRIRTIELQRVVVARNDLTVEILPITKTTAQGLVRVTSVAAAPTFAGVRLLSATGSAGPRVNAPVVHREARLFQPPPIR